MDSAKLIDTDDYRRLFLDDVPMLDVRAPVEFAEGAFPQAENHPLIDNQERHEIGICYKVQGHRSAIELGERLVSGDTKQRRIESWRHYLDQHPDAVLYCFRGGMRSKISQRWLAEEANISCPRVRGGYKAMRRFLLDSLEETAPRSQPLVLGGRTGVGKTRVLARTSAHIDLERLAWHRGSAFGHHASPQPSQIDFENALSIALLKIDAQVHKPFLLEDESRNIGSRHIPHCVFQQMEKAPLILLEASQEERIEITLQEYVHDALGEFCALHGDEQGFHAWANYLENSLDRIQRRLGGDRHRQARQLLRQALDDHRLSGTTERHRAWIAYLLTQYYDGMYEFQLSKKRDRIVFCGNANDVFDYLSQQHGIANFVPSDTEQVRSASV